MKLILAQLNYIVGDIEGNALKILQAYETGRSEDGLLICSELALTGYYPQDLVYQTDFLSRQDKMLAMLAEATEGYMGGMVVGMIARNESGTGKRLYNALVVLQNGQQTFEYHKRLLPTYNVFDEARHFKSGENSAIFNYRGFRIGVLICEDAWVQSGDFVYAHDPVKALANHTLDLVISLNASPSNLGKLKERQIIISKVANELDVPVVYVNQVGGNDELVFDGASFIVNRQGQIVFQLTAFEEQIAAIELNKIEHSVAVPYSLNDSELFYRQTVLGIKDYVQKCGFSQVVIGSSGGIDSAVTLAICTEALGAENMTAITMPSPFSSKGSVDDSRDLCENLGVKLLFSSIAEEFELAKKQFEQMTGEVPSSLTLENIQARIRGRKLMEYSNHYGALVVSTGNKSEMSVGYATLYGDMNGGINPLGDLYKMEVYALAHYINQKAEKNVIPLDIIVKAPSAELSENQRDSDSLPDYPILDAILKRYIEGDLLDSVESQLCTDTIKQSGMIENEIAKIHRMVDNAEFKRRQAPPIIRVQKRSFGMGRRLPVAAISRRS